MLLLDGHVLLRLDRLVEALGPSPALHDATRELVDDLHLAVLDDVLLVAVVQRLRLQRLREVVDELDVARVVEVVDPERALDLLDAARERRHGLELLVVRVVGVRLGAALDLRRRHVRLALQLLHDTREVVVRLRRRLGLAGDDQRRARLVDEDRVDLVHDRVRVALLDRALERHGHVVAEVVEAELGVRPVRDVAAVRRATLVERHEVLDRADGGAERLVDRPRPLRVALREVVVDGDEVDVAPRERVEVERLHCGERLSLTRLLLRDVALVEDDAGHELDVEEAHADRPLERLAHGRIRLEEDLLERLAVLDALLELGGLAAQLVVRERLELGLERADVGRLLGEPLDPPALADAQDLLERAEVLGHRT